MFRVRETGSLPAALLGAFVLHAGMAGALLLGPSSARVPASQASTPIEMEFSEEAVRVADESPVAEESAATEDAPRPASNARRNGAPRPTVVDAPSPTNESARSTASSETPDLESAPAEGASDVLASATSELVGDASKGEDALSVSPNGAGSVGGASEGARGRDTPRSPSGGAVVASSMHGPRLLRSPSCSDLFSRASLTRAATAVVAVDETGAATLARLLLPNAPPALLGASKKCVERIAFEPARDATGHATRGVARLRIRLAPSEG